MPTRRIMELAVVVAVAVHPVAGMIRLWAAKHLATSNNPATQTGAKVLSRVF